MAISYINLWKRRRSSIVVPLAAARAACGNVFLALNNSFHIQDNEPNPEDVVELLPFTKDMIQRF